MHENTRGRVTFLVNLMFRRLDKFDGPIFGGGWGCGHIYGGAYIWDANWFTYLRGVYSGGVLTGFYGVFLNFVEKYVRLK